MAGKVKFAVGGGGTGGHAIPALSICEAILGKRENCEVVYVGSKGSIEERLAGERDYSFRKVKTAKLVRGNIFQNLALPFVLTVAIIQASFHLISSGAKFVIGTGGFSAWPICTAAKLFGRSYFLQEQNAFPGLVTRMLAGGARKIYLGYDEARQRLRVPDDKMIYTGNPIPGKVRTGNPEKAREKLGLKQDCRTIMVTGGSGGALSINRVINDIREEIISRGYNLVWQTGKHWDEDRETLEGFEDRIMIRRFLDADTMALAYQAADLVIARSGAMTLAELAMMGLPAILIPFPHAAENHQEFNARAVEKAGGAMVILDNEMNADSVLDSITLAMEEEKHREMAESMKNLAKPNAAAVIAEDILSRMRC